MAIVFLSTRNGLREKWCELSESVIMDRLSPPSETANVQATMLLYGLELPPGLVLAAVMHELAPVAVTAHPGVLVVLAHVRLVIEPTFGLLFPGNLC
jgi:hypothetical protein